MRLISIFNNKGGVGKTTLTFHLAHALAHLGHRTLMIDLDPQCNLTIMAMSEEQIHTLWAAEDPYIEDFKSTREQSSERFEQLAQAERTIHFLLKPTEDGVTDVEFLSKPHTVAPRLDLIPGRLTMHLYEDKISARWSDVYQGDPLAIRTATRVRELAMQYSAARKYDYVVLDTSPSLGMLNKVIISTADGFVIPCLPDLFSLYGIRNIGRALGVWEKQFQTIYHLLSAEKRKSFPVNFVRLLGFTVYNAKKFAGQNPFDLAAAHYNYAKQIPDAIKKHVPLPIRSSIAERRMSKAIGGLSIMHSHNTLPAMAQKYHVPMWSVPTHPDLERADAMTVQGNKATYEGTRAKYCQFAKELLDRISDLSSNSNDISHA